MNKIKEIRQNMGRKAADVAHDAGITEGYLCHLENGGRSNPSRAVMERIAKALDSTVPAVFYPDEGEV